MREISPFGLRMPADLRQQVQREAKINGRSLNAEILDRLKESLAPPRRGREARQPAADYTVMTDSARSMLAIFNRLEPEKQLALLSLFK